jgi:mRNA interferase RelE/StbE
MIDRMVEAIDALGEQPRPAGARKLSGAEHRYRIRVGDYRVIYTIEDSSQTVTIERVRHRSAAYR